MMDTRNADLAKIHLAKRDLRLDDTSYRALLRRIAGVDSAADLDLGTRARVLAEFRRLGWRPGRPRRAGPPRPGDDPQLRKIRALWLALADAGAVRDRSERALNRFVRRQTRVARLEWLSVYQARSVIEALKGWLGRVKGEE